MAPTRTRFSRFPLLKFLVSLLLCVLFLAGGVELFLVLAAMKEAPPRREEPERIYAVEAYLVEQSDLQEIVTAFGTTRPNREVTLVASVPGKIVEVRGPENEGGMEKGLKVGQQVRGPEIRALESGISDRFPGDLLLRIDPATYQERIAQAENLIAEDRVALRQLRQEQKNNDRLLVRVTADYNAYLKQYNRVKDLKERGVATEAELTNAELQLARYDDSKIQHENEQALFPIRIEQMEKQIKRHQTDLALTKLDLDRTEVRAPFSGVISDVFVEQGKFVGAGEPLFRVTDTADVEIPLPLTLYDYAKIERKLLAGEMPRVELAEHETAPTRWIGYVVRAAPEADLTSRTIEVYVHVDNDGDDNRNQPIALLPSVFVHASIDGPVLEQAIVVPRDAIRDGKLFVVTDLKLIPRPTGGLGWKPATSGESESTDSSMVWEGVAEERPVTVQRTLRTLALVSAGLKPGDHVVMTNLDVVHDGAKVRVESRYGLSETLRRQGTKVLRPHTLAGGGPEDDRKTVN